MKRPRLLDVFGLMIPIEYVDPDTIGGDYGEYCREFKTIKINEELKSHTMIQTIIHELGHAIFDRAGFNQSIGPELEEVLCETFATIIEENFILKTK